MLLIPWIYRIHCFLPPTRSNMTRALSRINIVLVLGMRRRRHPWGIDRNGDGKSLLSPAPPLMFFHSCRSTSWGRIGIQLRLNSRWGRMPHACRCWRMPRTARRKTISMMRIRLMVTVAIVVSWERWTVILQAPVVRRHTAMWRPP